MHRMLVRIPNSGTFGRLLALHRLQNIQGTSVVEEITKNSWLPRFTISGWYVCLQKKFSVTNFCGLIDKRYLEYIPERPIRALLSR